MSTKYILSPDGTIIKNDNVANKTTILSGSNLLNVVPNLNDKKSRVSEVIENDSSRAFIFTNELTNSNTFEEGSSDKSDLKDYVIGQTKELINKSFGFIDDNFQNINDDQFKEKKYYRSYNSFFDLDLDSNFESGLQIFANDLDFYGFSPETLKDPAEFGDDVIRKILTTLDILIAAALPILTISTLQALIQSEQGDISSKRNFELGKYISYSISNSSNDLENLSLLALERTLNSFERLMNYPRFKKISFNFSEFIDDIGYFALGFISYILPGLNTKFPNNFDNIKGTKIISDIISSFTTANQSRHIFNLLVRKIARNNYFLKSYLNSDSLKTTNENEEVNSFVKNLSYLGSYFYRFVGERVGVGERIYTLQSPRLKKEKFGITRLSEDLDIEKENINLNTNISSFRSSFVTKTQDENGENQKNQLSIFNLMTNNTHTMYNELNENNNRIKRLSADIVKNIETQINSDYMPFSIHDIRTNEVFKFHAFIENVSDSFSPEYTTSTGFGRMDPVRIYNSTSRSISVDFWMVSTSEEDHNEMWYYINRLVTCLYPQWSKPLLANQKDIDMANSPFARPFTQIPVASPLVRLRLGDLITSNYSRKKVKEEIFDIKDIKDTISLYDFFKNIYNIIDSNLKSITSGPLVTILTNIEEDNENIKNINIPKEFAKPLYINFTVISEPLKEYTFDNFITLDQKDLEEYNITSVSSILKKYWFKITIISPEPIYSNIDSLFNFLPANMQKKLNSDIKEYKERLILEYENNNASNRFLFEQKFNYDLINTSTAQATNEGLDVNARRSDLITRPNAIISSYEATKGEGIAGFINNLNLDFQSSVWDIKPGNIAPQMVKLTMQFNPIHDIPLGMNYKGGMRSAAYNVGKINRSYFKD
jgi:hypothetical protein